jgi:hypothetical protein
MKTWSDGVLESWSVETNRLGTLLEAPVFSSLIRDRSPSFLILAQVVEEGIRILGGAII